MVGHLAVLGSSEEADESVVYWLHMPVGRKKTYAAKLHVGFGDTGEPVVTVLRPGED